MTEKAKNLIEFFKMVGKLKRIRRTGWVLRGVNDPECVAGHMYRMAMMALLIPESSGLDGNKCMRLALVHDLAECIVGDLTPFCGVAVEEKHQREEEAIKELSKLIGESSEILIELSQEYAKQETAEAQMVKDLDRLDMILQAYEYETESTKNLQEFFDSTRGKFKNPWVLELVEELYKQRNKSVKT